MPTFIEELRNRSMLHTLMPGTEKLLQTLGINAYIGIDPTAPSLHIGNLATLMLLRHFHQAGHQPFVLLGGATAMIGDPSFKSSERKLLDKATIEHNQAAIEKQIHRLFPPLHNKKIKIINNYTWLHQESFLSFLRDVGKHISVNYLLAKESIKKRMQHNGISYTEFAYPLLQAYDFYRLYKQHNVKLQMGGSDQWGNITTGVEFIRKKRAGQAFGLTTSLLTKSDGTKFGKTEQGNIWLDPNMTSPYAFYQFWINTTDQEAAMLLKRLTLLDMPTIDALIEQHTTSPHHRLLQKTLAKEMTCSIHNQKAFEKAKKASELLFGTKNAKDLLTLDEKTLLQALSNIPHLHFTQEEISQKETLLALLCHDKEQPKIFASRKIAKEKIKAGALHINHTKITDPFSLPDLHWLCNKFLLLQKGKKHYYLIKRID